MSTEAMKLALEALEETVHWRTTGIGRPPEQTAIDAITALQEALAQPQQEPVAWADMSNQDRDVGLSWTPGQFHTVPLYTSPPAQEFVCSTGLCHYRKPLTDEQVSAIWKAVPNQALYEAVMVFARAIEAAHGIKGDA